MKKLAHLYFCFLGVVTGVAFTIHSALADDHEIEEVVVVGEIVGELGLLEPLSLIHISEPTRPY